MEVINLHHLKKKDTKLIKGIRAIEECMGDGQKEILERDGLCKKLKFKSID